MEVGLYLLILKKPDDSKLLETIAQPTFYISN